MTVPIDTRVTEAPDDGSAGASPRRQRANSTVRHLAAAFSLPLVLYVVLRPENYGLTPNGLDPVFYTGYSMNLDDLLQAVGDHHYFVSRWSVYYPMYVFDRVFGPLTGRLMWRWTIAGTILCCLWSLGRRLRWTRTQQLLTGVIVLTMPMFVRAFFTDYVEYLVVSAGVCLYCLCLKEVQTTSSSLLMGGLCALIVVANPFALSIVVLPIAVATYMGSERWTRRLILMTATIASALVTVVVGFLAFRWRYGINNVYSGTIDFLRTTRGKSADPLRSPRLDWLWHFTWLYATPVALVAAAGLVRMRRVILNRAETTALVLAGAQYVIQWLDQFVRGGDGLEISYYWSFSYPSFAIALAVLLAACTRMARQWHLGLITAGWLALLLLGVPSGLRLPAGVPFFLLGVVLVGGVVAVGRRATAVATAVLLGFVGWTQLGAPKYDPSAYFVFNLSPRYDELFRRSGDVSERALDEALWFARQMDLVPGDANASFVPAGGFAGSIVGLYAPHVVGRLIETTSDATRLGAASIAQIRGGARPLVAVFGPAERVQAIITTFPTDLGVGREVLDATDPHGLGYRLAVFQMPDQTQLPFTWSASVLPVPPGRTSGSVVTVSRGDAPGVVTYGPYIPLPAGAYDAVLEYRSGGGVDEQVGVFDVSSMKTGTLTSVAILGTRGESGTLTIHFELASPQGPWEFRTIWNGTDNLSVASVTLSRVSA